MVQSPASPMDQVLRALADPVRRGVVEHLGAGPLRAGELADRLGTSPPTMSRHLKVLLDAGLVTDERPADDARVRVFRLRPGSITPVQSWLDRLGRQWDEQLRSFQQHVEHHPRRQHQPPDHQPPDQQDEPGSEP